MATLPTSAPVHTGFSKRELLGYIADYSKALATQTAAALPTSAPVHTGFSDREILGYIADNTQPV